MANKLAQLLQKARQQGFEDGLYQGLQFGVNLTAIAFNHRYGFGDKRLTLIQGDVQKLVDEVVDVNDPAVTEEHIRYEMRRIRGENYEKSEREVMEP